MIVASVRVGVDPYGLDYYERIGMVSPDMAIGSTSEVWYAYVQVWSETYQQRKDRHRG